jgi:hypothetical protein
MTISQPPQVTAGSTAAGWELLCTIVNACLKLHVHGRQRMFSKMKEEAYFARFPTSF